MDELERLKRKRDEINEEIRELEEERKESKRRKALHDDYVKVVCRDCSGLGEVPFEAVDHFPEEKVCEDCDGKGYLWARRFEGRKTHDMEYSDV